MTKITFSQIESTTVNTDLKGGPDPTNNVDQNLLATNFDKQWLDRYGVIKTNRDTINESITIPSNTNGYSAGTIKIGAGHSVTVNGEWRIV